MKKKRKPESRQKRVIIRTIQNVVLWVVVSSIIIPVAFYVEEETSYLFRNYIRMYPFAFLPKLAIAICILLFNLATTDVLRHYVRQHERNVISWTTASLLFTPILAGIVYLLTWPKDKKLTGLEG